VVGALADRITRESTFDRLPGSVDRFEDCLGLFSWNQLNHGVSRLMLDEAGYLYRLVRELERPRVAELGRYRGGTTFMLAAAGADVLSIDKDISVARFDEALIAALERHGLRDHVTLKIADSQTYPVAPSSLDLVFVDADHSYDGARADVRRWLPGLVSGGHLLMHDAVRPDPPTPWRDPLNVEGLRRLHRELLEDHGLLHRGTAGTLAHFAVSNDRSTAHAREPSSRAKPPSPLDRQPASDEH
jgi:predicted O-methyltransferase YrrM